MLSLASSVVRTVKRCSKGEVMRFCVSLLAVAAVAAAGAQTTPDTFVFDDNLFGNTLLESDGGTFSFSNWLNVVQSNPGNPGFLTGVGFDTGIGNIGMGGISTTYTIGYSTTIFNNPGDDLGVVVARYTEDDISLAVSEDGSGFSSIITFGPQQAFDTGVHKLYFYGGGGPFDAELFVQPVDLSDFGVAPGAGIVAARVTGSPQLDLVRVAGFQAVPEPASMLALGLGLGVFWRSRRRMA